MKCSYEPCDRKQYGKADICRAHWMQNHRGGELKPLKKRAAVNHWRDGKKICPKCGVSKGRDGYYPDTSTSSGLTSHCKTCQCPGSQS